jgi:serine protease Do
VVTKVYPNTPGSAAGLKTGDVILKFAGQTVTSPRKLKEMIEESKEATHETMEVLRDEKPLSLTVMLQAMPSGFGQMAQSSEEGGQSPESAFHDLGIHVAPLTEKKAEQLGLTHTQGVLITSVDSGSVAAEAGLTEGMVISQVGHTPVKTVEGFRAAVEKESLKKGILFLVNSKEGSMFVVLRAE